LLSLRIRLNPWRGSWPIISFSCRNAPWFVALVAATLMGAKLERLLGRIFRRRWPKRRHTGTMLSLVPAPEPFDAARQLRSVERATFRARPILNHGEARLFGVIERACAVEAPGWRVMAQVSLGEIRSSPDEEAFRAINSKRVDLLLVDVKGLPLHAIELQGSGHHLGPAATRDAIKKEALRKAGIGYVEVMPGDTPAEIAGRVRKLAVRQLASGGR
jgi:hypothetical protein